MSIRFEWRGNTDTEDLLAVPNNQTPTFTAAPPTPPTFEFHGPDNKPMVTIRHTGEVELAPGLEISEASRLFWQGLADAFPAWRRAAIDAAPEAPQLTIPPGYKLVPIQKLTANTDDKHDEWRFGDGEDSTSGPKDCAVAIRQLKDKT